MDQALGSQCNPAGARHSGTAAIPITKQAQILETIQSPQISIKREVK